MKDCRFVANSAKLYGGAVAQSSIFGAVQTSNFQSNTALHGGGAYQLNVVGAVERGVFSQNVAGLCLPLCLLCNAVSKLLQI